MLMQCKSIYARLTPRVLHLPPPLLLPPKKQLYPPPLSPSHRRRSSITTTTTITRPRLCRRFRRRSGWHPRLSCQEARGSAWSPPPVILQRWIMACRPFSVFADEVLPPAMAAAVPASWKPGSRPKLGSRAAHVRLDTVSATLSTPRLPKRCSDDLWT